MSIILNASIVILSHHYYYYYGTSRFPSARALDLASRRQQMTPQPRATAADGSALLTLLLLLSQPPLLLLPPSREATAVGEQQPSRAEPILKPSLLIGGSNLLPLFEGFLPLFVGGFLVLSLGGSLVLPVGGVQVPTAMEFPPLPAGGFLVFPKHHSHTISIVRTTHL